jgi:hypothetical protein
LSQTAPISFVDLKDELTLYVKQAAWLNTIPEKQKVPRRQIKNVPMPQLRAGEYLIELLYEIGPVKPAGMGVSSSIDETDLLAWQANQSVSLLPWESKMIRVLSREYASMLAEASSPSCPAPYIASLEVSPEARDSIYDVMSSWADKLNSAKGFN